MDTVVKLCEARYIGHRFQYCYGTQKQGISIRIPNDSKHDFLCVILVFIDRTLQNGVTKDTGLLINVMTKSVRHVNYQASDNMLINIYMYMLAFLNYVYVNTTTDWSEPYTLICEP